jgi:nucleotide-binding universal stress UspA family protein
MMRSSHVLCPLDLSAHSRRTFDRAASIAALDGGSVTVLYVSPTPSLAAMPYVGPDGLAPFPYPEVDRAKVMADMNAVLGLPRDVGVPVAIEIVEAPSVHREILGQAARLQADIIVMGTHGRSGVERLLLGSVAEKVLRTAPIPVVTVPGAAAPRAGFRRIVCGVDFSEWSGDGLEYAAAFAATSGAALTVVHVVEAPPVAADPMVGVVLEAPDYREALVRGSTRHLREYVAAHVDGSAPVKRLITQGRAAAEILQTASDEDADLIVLGIRGRNAVDRFVFGSTADHVVRQASCAVLTVRGPRPAARKAAS